MTHFILPGSFEAEGTMLTAGVHVGESEFAPKGLRYIQADLSKMHKDETALTFMARIYDNSTGCLVKGGFKEN